ncbi:MAG: NYN domain-containing protein [Candidatus Paceibacterota bacterium]
MENIAYVDGQNLFLGIKNCDNAWEVDLSRFRIYLEKKYHVAKAYYYLGFVQDGQKYESLYEEIQSAGFILVFREHNSAMLGKKKGNVDSDIIFSIMKRLYKAEEFNKIVLVSGDGDYKMLIDFLIEENKLEKILFPDGKRASSLYKQITRKYFDDLGKKDIRHKIEKEKGALGS